MALLYIFRILIVVLAVMLFFIFARRITKRPIHGVKLIGSGIVLLSINLITGFIFHGSLLPENFINQLFPFITTITGVVAQTLGIGIIIIGVYRLVQSLTPHLDQNYTSLVEHSLVGVYVVQDGVFKFVNDRLAEICGYEREELINQKVMNFIHPDDRRKVALNIAKKLEGEVQSINYEVTAIKKNGDKIDLEVFGNRTYYKGRPAVQGMLLDITARKQALEVILAGEERFRTLANSSYDIICETTPDGTILYLSANVKEILGYDSYELINANALNLLDKRDVEQTKNEFKRALQEKDSGRAQFRCKDKSGKWHWFECTGEPYITGSGETRVILVSRDVTSRKKMEEEIFKTSKLESIGVLAGGIAHDFNNILTVILGNVSLAKSYFNSNDIEPLQILSDAEKACSRARELTAQFLTFARGGDPIKQTIQIQHLLKDAIDFALRGSKAKCKFTCDENLWQVDADKSQMSQVIQNLMINADQAMPDGGLIRVHAENKILDENRLSLPPGNYVKIIFVDEGIGIAEEHINKIFDPYFSTKYKGSGLGLATAYSIIKNHDGHIGVESKAGSGTTFTLYLPANIKYTAKRQLSVTSNESTGRYGKVLVMDDEEPIRKIASRILNRFGFEVALAEDGKEALSLYEHARSTNKPFDAVLIDLTIPGGMGGKETMENLIRFDPSVKAVVSSGYSNDPIMADYKKYGFRGVIAKPYRFDSLGQILNEIISEG